MQASLKGRMSQAPQLGTHFHYTGMSPATGGTSGIAAFLW